LKVAAEAWLLAGGPHHTSFSTALRREHLEDFAEMAGIELVTIGDATSVADIKKELRWNQAYHQLARGL
jgi:L-arabinose isomerase